MLKEVPPPSNDRPAKYGCSMSLVKMDANKHRIKTPVGASLIAVKSIQTVRMVATPNPLPPEEKVYFLFHVPLEYDPKDYDVIHVYCALVNSDAIPEHMRYIDTIQYQGNFYNFYIDEGVIDA